MTIPTTVRLPLILMVAVLVNVLMFSAMQYMVGRSKLRLDDTAQFDIANFIRMTEQSRPVKTRRDERAPEKPSTEQQRQLAQMSQAPLSASVGGLAVGVPEFEVDISSAISTDIQIARELTPLVRTLPEYPMRALMNKVEGFVLLRFTVTESGAVADPEVIRSDPPGVFDSSALRSIRRWKYQPQLVGGKPVSVISVARINYILEENLKKQ